MNVITLVPPPAIWITPHFQTIYYLPLYSGSVLRSDDEKNILTHENISRYSISVVYHVSPESDKDLKKNMSSFTLFSRVVIKSHRTKRKAELFHRI